MQVFLRGVDGVLKVIWTHENALISSLKEVAGGEQWSVHCNGRRLVESRSLASCGVLNGHVLETVGQLRGGVPVKVQVLGAHLPCGPEVVIDIEDDATKREIKRKLLPETGIPIQEQKVILAGVGQLAVGDKRTAMRYGACGSTGNVYMAVATAKQQQEREREKRAR